MIRTLLATSGVILLAMAAALDGQSLAGAAKKAEEQSTKAKQDQTADGKKTEKPPTKVFTNKDLAEVPPATTAAKSQPSADTSTATSKSSKTAGSGDVKDENSWRLRAREVRKTLADDQTKLAAAKAHFDSLPDQAKGPLGAPVVEAWMKAKEDISRLTAVVANDQRALSELEDEARRAGVPPGWLREK